MAPGRAALATPLARPIDLSAAWNASDEDLAARFHPRYAGALARLPDGPAVFRGLPSLRAPEAIIASGEADAVSLARAMLYDPRWPWHAAAQLGARVSAPHQYWRSQPREYKDLFENAAFGAR